MEKKTKNWISNFAISASSVAALVAPIATTVAYQSKTTAKAPAGINASEEVAAASVYTTPQNLPTHFENSLEGFKGIYQTLEKLYQDIKVDYTKLEAFYNAYQAKADNLIMLTNAILTHRSFWSSLWSGIKHIATSIGDGIVHASETVAGALATAGTAIATGVVEAANVVSEGALDSAAKTMENATIDAAEATANSAAALGNNLTDLVKDVFGVDFKDLSHSDWLKLGLSMLLFVPGVGEVAGTAEVAKTVAAKAVENITNAFIKKVAQGVVKWGTEALVGVPYVEFANGVIKQTQTFTMDEVKNQSGFPENLRNDIKPGDYYFKSGDTGIHLVVTA